MTLVSELQVTDFRTMRALDLELGPLSALVGESQAGKSNVLAAIRAVLDPARTPVLASDVRRGAPALRVRARLADGTWLEVAGTPPAVGATGAGAPPVLFLPAAERDGHVLPQALATHVRRRTRGLLILIEEPELYLRPQEQRYLSRVLRGLAADGNQVVYSTHAPAFLNVARMDELVFVERRDKDGTRALRPRAPTPDEDFRVLSEFDAERAELFLARAALLVEGATEKLALPFVFAALGEDADRERISIVECGGKANLVLFARVCRAAGVPFAVLHDRDARPGRRPSAANRQLHDELVTLAGADRVVELAPDFEAVARLQRGNRKPERAWRRFAGLAIDRMPGELVRVARLALRLARPVVAP